MKKNPLLGLLFGMALTAATPAAERLTIAGNQLDLKAQTRACYLGFLKLYDVDYFRGAAGDASCIRLSYLREFGAATLGEATRTVFEQRHGEAAAERYRSELGRVADAYRAVVPGDQYLYCIDEVGTGTLLRDGATAAQLSAPEFARRFLQIWVQAEGDAHEPVWAFRRC